jgi:translation initiation factor IF-1
MEQGEIVGIVESMLGANRVKVRSLDGKLAWEGFRAK